MYAMHNGLETRMPLKDVLTSMSVMFGDHIMHYVGHVYYDINKNLQISLLTSLFTQLVGAQRASVYQ